MDEQRVHMLAAEVGEALKRLEQFRDVISGLAAGMTAVQADMAGLDVQLRLIAEAEALRREADGKAQHSAPDSERAGEAGPVGNTQPAGGTGQGVPGWFAQTWQDLVRQVAEAAAAAEAAETEADGEPADGAPDSKRTGATVTDDESQHLSHLSALHPLLERLAVLFRRLARNEDRTGLEPLTEQFSQVVQRFERLAVSLSGAVALTQAPAQAVPQAEQAETIMQPQSPWEVAIDLPRLKPADYVNLVTQEGGPVPQINLSVVMAALEEEVNQAIRRWFEARRAIRLEAKRKPHAGRLAAEWQQLVDGLTDLQATAATFVKARQESGAAVPEAAVEVQRLLDDALRQMTPARQRAPLHRTAPPDPSGRSRSTKPPRR